MATSWGSKFYVVTTMLSGILSACGGGSSAPPPQLTLDVRLISGGTLVECGSTIPTQARLTMNAGNAPSTEQGITCPSQRLLAGKYALARWDVAPLPMIEVDGVVQGSAHTWTSLPPPSVLRDGEGVLAIRNAALEAVSVSATLEQISGPIASALSVQNSSRSEATLESVKGDHWRWSITVNGVSYVSPVVPTRQLSIEDSGQWGAMALAEPTTAGASRLMRADEFPGTLPGQFTQGRNFRDIRYVDLNNDGLLDVVSNVYGNGCALIAIAEVGGMHTVKTPLRSDGSCIGGHGETILVADFDGDGLTDIFLPSYERFDYLKNLGNGEFAEMADALGISFPAYVPFVEGAAAVDIDLDGDVDIVVASEVLINDGRGRFAALPTPFGPDRIFDEGMSVADIDRDGIFDIAKHDPRLGPRIFWGLSGTTFVDAGWMFGGVVVSSSSFGLAIGDLTGNDLPDLVLAGGRAIDPVQGIEAGATGEGPRLCAQTSRRAFKCLTRFVPAIDNAWSDLVMVTDTNGDGLDELVARYGTLITYTPSRTADLNVFRFDLRDVSNRRSLHGHALKATCELDASLVALKSIDGGNGYMAQGEYVVSFTSRWCKRVRLETGGPSGPVTLGSFAPGTHLVKHPRTS